MVVHFHQNQVELVYIHYLFLNQQSPILQDPLGHHHHFCHLDPNQSHLPIHPNHHHHLGHSIL